MSEAVKAGGSTRPEESAVLSRELGASGARSGGWGPHRWDQCFHKDNREEACSLFSATGGYRTAKSKPHGRSALISGLPSLPM